MLDTSQPGGPEAQKAVLSASPRLFSNRRLGLAMLCSAVIPGAGHFIIKRRNKGLGLLATSSTLIVLYWVERIPANVIALLFTILGTMLLCIYAGCDAGYFAHRPGQRGSQLWVLLAFPAGILGGVVSANLGSLASGIRAYTDPSSAMEHTIPEGSRAMVDTRYYQNHSLQRGDIIIFEHPHEPGLYMVKRVIALGGETVDIDADRVAVNGNPLTEPYAFIDQKYPDPKPHFHLTVPTGKIFVLGDNRHVSLDSRFDQLGLPGISSLRGKVLYVMPGFDLRKKGIETGSD